MFSSYAGSTKLSLFATPVEEPRTKSFSYVIAGGKSSSSTRRGAIADGSCGAGGTAGCVLASRLSEDPSVSVLLIEAGESDQRQLMSKIPAGWGNLWKTAAEWNYNTVPQKEAAGRELYQPRGKMLGGCSAINAQIVQHCSPSDYDDWEAKGATGWSWESLKPYFRKAELFTPNPLHNVDQSHHGDGGLWHSSYPPTNELSTAFISAGANAGIPATDDLNTSGSTMGITRFLAHVSATGQRCSTSAGYLTKDVYSRSNLKILTGTTVTRLVFEGTRVVGVEVGQSKDGARWHVGADKEVVFSLGAFGSPHVLLASGVGPKEVLAKAGVALVKDLPVGQGLRDHVLSTITWEAKKGSSLQFLTNPIATLPHLVRWLWNGTGPLGTNLAEGGAFLRSDDIPGQVSSIAKGTTNASGPTAPDLELINAPLAFVHHGLEVPANPKGDYFTMGPVVLRPLSRGTVTISSDNTFDAPIIDPQYLTNPLDKAVLLEGTKLARRIAQTEPLKSLLGPSATPLNLETLDDEGILQHISEQAETIYHPMSTCAIGIEGKGGVIDSQLRVYGLQGIRICDASVFPDSVAGHPVAAVVAVAERAADLLKGVIN